VRAVTNEKEVDVENNLPTALSQPNLAALTTFEFKPADDFDPVAGSSDLADLDLRALTERVRASHAATRSACVTALRAAMDAGDASIEGRNRVGDDTPWKKWMKDSCFVAVRTAQLYEQLARNRSKIEQAIRDKPDLSIRGARKLLIVKRIRTSEESPADGTHYDDGGHNDSHNRGHEHCEAGNATQYPTQGAPPQPIVPGNEISDPELTAALDRLGPERCARCLPPAWDMSLTLNSGTGMGEVARLHKRIAELQSEIHQLKKLLRQVGASPDDDLDIPPRTAVQAQRRERAGLVESEVVDLKGKNAELRIEIEALREKLAGRLTIKPNTKGWKAWSKEQAEDSILAQQRWNYVHPDDLCDFHTMEKIRARYGLRPKLAEHTEV
jgi:hypothetical protein